MSRCPCACGYPAGGGCSRARGEPIIDDSFLVLFNAWQDGLSFRLPPARFGRRRSLELSTADPGLEAGAWEAPVRGEVEVEGCSLLLLRRVG